TAMIQTIGRAARNEHGRVIMYADRMTDSMQRAIDETTRRREKQAAHNLRHGITPTTIHKQVVDLIRLTKVAEEATTTDYGAQALKQKSEQELQKLAKGLEKQMAVAAKELDFERAAEYRDRLIVVKGALGQKLVPKTKPLRLR
ncbi:MAG: UvrB/UvrC motif-containing protein, partial [Acidaminococcaceae bacterium]